MKIKVNRIKSKDEIKLLRNEGVDVIGISIDRHKTTDTTNEFDSRALSIEEALNIKSQTKIPHLSIHINYYNWSESIYDRVLKELNPTSLNIHLPTSSFGSINDSSYKYFESTVKRLNNINQEIIVFGDGFMYDDGGFRFNKRELSKLNNLKYVELNSFTINNKESHYIKSKAEWQAYFDKYNIQKEIEQNKLGDLIQESVTNQIEDVEVLINDKFLTTLEPSQLKNWNCNGVTMSIESLEDDIFTNKKINSGISEMANYYAINEILENTKRIKKHYT